MWADRPMRIQAIGGVLAAALLGCGSQSTEPTAPSNTAGAADVRGTWFQANGDMRTWVLEQGGIQAGGTASFSPSNNPGVGAVSGVGGVTGALVQ